MSDYRGGQIFRGQWSFNTFHLLWCGDCGRAEEVTERTRVPRIAGVLDCGECGKPLIHLEAFIRSS